MGHDKLSRFPGLVIALAAGLSVGCGSEGTEAPGPGPGTGLMAVQDAGDHAEVLWARNDLSSRGIAPQRGVDRAYAVVGRAGRLLGLRLLVLDTRTGATLDEEPINPLGAATVGTTLSEDGRVYVPDIINGIWGFAPESGFVQ